MPKFNKSEFGIETRRLVFRCKSPLLQAMKQSEVEPRTNFFAVSKDWSFITDRHLKCIFVYFN